MDPNDGMEGLYSQRAGELWEDYSANAQNDTADEIGNEISREVRVPGIGAAIRGLSQFFRRKRIRDRDKILLHNGDVVLFEPKRRS